jgi:hypothetical protein
MEWDLELGGAQATAIALALLFGSLLLAVCLWNRASGRRCSQSAGSDTVEMQAAMARLAGELPQLLRHMNSRLDSKMQALRNLIREADTTIQELYRLNAPHTPDADTTPATQAGVLPGELAAAEPTDIDAPLPITEPKPDQRKPPELSVSDTAELRAQRYAHVYSLADRGLDPAGISGETGMHRGEVELVLNLRRKRVRVDRGGRTEPAPVVRSPEEAPA